MSPVQKTDADAHEYLERIGKALLPVVRDLEPHAVAPTSEELVQAASQLVLELQMQGFVISPKREYDELVTRGWKKEPKS